MAEPEPEQSGTEVKSTGVTQNSQVDPAGDAAVKQLLDAGADPNALVPERDREDKTAVGAREKELEGSGGSREPPGPLLTRLHTV